MPKKKAIVESSSESSEESSSEQEVQVKRTAKQLTKSKQVSSKSVKKPVEKKVSDRIITQESSDKSESEDDVPSKRVKSNCNPKQVGKQKKDKAQSKLVQSDSESDTEDESASCSASEVDSDDSEEIIITRSKLEKISSDINKIRDQSKIDIIREIICQDKNLQIARGDGKIILSLSDVDKKIIVEVIEYIKTLELDKQKHQKIERQPYKSKKYSGTLNTFDKKAKKVHKSNIKEYKNFE